jgi:trk system potassium uptake protein TrkH
MKKWIIIGVIVLALLILLGGLGFFVWLDILRCRFRFARFSLHTKLVVVTSGLLLLGGTLLFFLLYGNSAAAEGASLGERLLVSFFQSVSVIRANSLPHSFA